MSRTRISADAVGVKLGCSVNMVRRLVTLGRSGNEDGLRIVSQGGGRYVLDLKELERLRARRAVIPAAMRSDIVSAKAV